MATYLELYSLLSNDELRNRVRVAVVVEAEAILSRTPAPTPNEAKWASDVITNVAVEGDKAFRAVLAANASATVPQITGASDTVLQNNVAAIVPALVLAQGV